jgi:hypothetical protein
MFGVFGNLQVCFMVATVVFFCHACHNKYMINKVLVTNTEKYSCPKTSTACRDFAATYLGVLLDKPSTLQADPNILRLALENDEANVSSEEKIYELVVRWASFDTPSDQIDYSTRITSGSSQENESSACMPSEPWERADEEKVYDDTTEDLGDGYSTEEAGFWDTQLENDTEKTDEPYTFPRPWEGDRLKAMPTLLKCVRFPIMQKGYLMNKVETNQMVMEAEGMKDLVSDTFIGSVDTLDKDS